MLFFLGENSSKRRLISHSEFHQNGYLTPVHLCRDRETGYVSFLVSDQENPTDEQDDDEKSERGDKSDENLEFSENQNHNNASESNYKSNTQNIEGVTRYERKPQKSFRHFRKKCRPNIKVLLKRSSSKDLQKSPDMEKVSSETPNFIRYSPKTPEPSNNNEMTNTSKYIKELNALPEAENEIAENNLETDNNTKDTVVMTIDTINKSVVMLERKSDSENSSDKNNDN